MRFAGMFEKPDPIRVFSFLSLLHFMLYGSIG